MNSFMFMSVSKKLGPSFKTTILEIPLLYVKYSGSVPLENPITDFGTEHGFRGTEFLR